MTRAARSPSRSSCKARRRSGRPLSRGAFGPSGLRALGLRALRFGAPGLQDGASWLRGCFGILGLGVQRAPRPALSPTAPQPVPAKSRSWSTERLSHPSSFCRNPQRSQLCRRGRPLCTELHLNDYGAEFFRTNRVSGCCPEVMCLRENRGTLGKPISCSCARISEIFLVLTFRGILALDTFRYFSSNLFFHCGWIKYALEKLLNPEWASEEVPQKDREGGCLQTRAKKFSDNLSSQRMRVHAT